MDGAHTHSLPLTLGTPYPQDRDLVTPLLTQLRPLEALLVARDPSRSSVNLWMGKPRVSAPCHYDGYQCATDDPLMTS